MPKGFDLAVPEVTRRLLVRIGGLEKQGKTHFGLTAPGPIGVLDMDRGLEGVVEKFADTKEIYVKNLRGMPSRTQADHERRWDVSKESYFTLLEDSKVRSVLMDTDTEWWEMARLAFFGKLAQIKPHHYAEVNREFRGLIDAAFDHDKNLILICKYKKQYVSSPENKNDSSWNGKYEEAGMNDLPFIVQVNLRAKIAMVDGEPTPTITAVNCRQNMDVTGEVFEGDMANFPWIAANIVEGTTPEEWE